MCKRTTVSRYQKCLISHWQFSRKIVSPRRHASMIEFQNHHLKNVNNMYPSTIQKRTIWCCYDSENCHYKRNVAIFGHKNLYFDILIENVCHIRRGHLNKYMFIFSGHCTSAFYLNQNGFFPAIYFIWYIILTAFVNLWTYQHLF